MTDPNILVKARASKISVRPYGTRVVVLVDGRLVMDIEHQLADQLGKSLVRQAKVAEETAKASKIVGDQAFLYRSGAPFAITNRPDIRKEALKEAIHGKELRKLLPGGVKSSVEFGVPIIRKNPPPPAEKPQKQTISGVGKIKSQVAFGKLGGK